MSGDNELSGSSWSQLDGSSSDPTGPPHCKPHRPAGRGGGVTPPGSITRWELQALCAAPVLVIRGGGVPVSDGRFQVASAWRRRRGFASKLWMPLTPALLIWGVNFSQQPLRSSTPFAPKMWRKFVGLIAQECRSSPWISRPHPCHLCQTMAFQHNIIYRAINMTASLGPARVDHRVTTTGGPLWIGVLGFGEDVPCSYRQAYSAKN